jgi:hypothetical protein
MKGRLAVLTIALWSALFCFVPLIARAQTNDVAEDPKLAAEEKEACTRNLKVIYDAIQAYQVDHKELPNWLSDLVPQYISDANVLICPVSKRTGEIESSELADPKIPSSYLYQFCPIPIGKKLSPNDPTKTRREWKRRQMGLVGSIVPLVRCHHHGMFLNLAFDGRIYDSPPEWERMFSNQVDVAELMPPRMFPGGADAKVAVSATVYPPRDPQAKPGLIDLSAFYNASLTESWHGNPKNDLSSLPSGLQTFAGVQYDVRGVIQLSAKLATLKIFPARVNGIKIRQKCERLHFLQAATFGSPKNEGEQVGSYILHFAANQMQLEIPIIYGRDVRDWYASANEKPGDKDLTVAWAGVNEAATAIHHTIRLFTSTWVNVAPGVEIESLDFVSSTNKVAPFLVAITAD